jgi:serine/threonine protein phosphatase PrpC
MTELSPNERIYLERVMDKVDVFEMSHGIAAVYSSVSPDKPTANEDAALLVNLGNGRAVFAVADGLGGERAGERASRAAIETLHACLRNAQDAEALRPVILNSIEQANQAVLDLNMGAGTTLAVVELEDGYIRPYHVGDSLVLLIGQRGRLKHQTVSHSPVGFALEAGLLNEKEAMHHEERHLVSNVVGTPDMRIEVGSRIRMAPRDTLLIASDGLFDNLLVEEIVSFIRKGVLPQVAKDMVDASTGRMLKPRPGNPSKPDDMTFVLYRRQAISASA